MKDIMGIPIRFGTKGRFLQCRACMRTFDNQEEFMSHMSQGCDALAKNQNKLLGRWVYGGNRAREFLGVVYDKWDTQYKVQGVILTRTLDVNVKLDFFTAEPREFRVVETDDEVLSIWNRFMKERESNQWMTLFFDVRRKLGADFGLELEAKGRQHR